MDGYGGELGKDKDELGKKVLPFIELLVDEVGDFDDDLVNFFSHFVFFPCESFKNQHHLVDQVDELNELVFFPVVFEHQQMVLVSLDSLRQVVHHLAHKLEGHYFAI